MSQSSTSGRDVSEPWVVAEAAAHRASVRIRPLETLDEMTRACQLLDRVWEIPAGGVSDVRPPLLRALGHAGNYLAGAFAHRGPNAGEMVAASVAFFGAPPGESLHSHITGVLPGAGRGIGGALKWHQRAWALDRDLRHVTWTYDPLIARNAFFNVTRLGARPVRYLVDFYGPMDDGPNRGQPTDRTDVEWELWSDDAARAAAAVLDQGAVSDGPAADVLRAAGAMVALSVGSDGEPAVGGSASGGSVVGGSGIGGSGVVRPAVGGSAAGPVLVGLPADIEAVRRSDQDRALRWRLALRDVLGSLLDDGWRVTGFAKSGWYVLDRKEQL